ncbi:MAG: FRG domain-containing protein [Prevotellaceae bacterium]|jgi:hypothetical protein|nr:FRG domain-containing protein [Prevotellaceae bacterium]
MNNTSDIFFKSEKVESFELIKEQLENMYDGIHIFRGVSDAEYKLIPSALRGDTVYEEMYNKCSHIYNGNFGGQIAREMILLFNFYRLANQQGLNIPRNEEFNHLVVINSYSNEKDLPKEWYEPNFEDIAALAQHYGLPTRMLDWTFDPFAALYFAIIGASKHILQAKTIDKQKYISIWTLYSELQMICDNNLRFVIPNYHNNPNLCAQQGLLVYWRRNVENEILKNLKAPPEDLIPLNEKIHNYLVEKRPEKLNFTRMCKYDLKYSEVPKALDFLLDRGLSAAKYFPGFDGIKKAMDEREMQYNINEIIKNK